MGYVKTPFPTLHPHSLPSHISIFIFLVSTLAAPAFVRFATAIPPRAPNVQTTITKLQLMSRARVSHAFWVCFLQDGTVPPSETSNKSCVYHTCFRYIFCIISTSFPSLRLPTTQLSPHANFHTCLHLIMFPLSLSFIPPPRCG